MRAVLVLLVGSGLLLGCSGAPCAGYAGTCVDLTVQGNVSGLQLDQLQITLSGARTGSQDSPPAPGERFALPVQLALHLGQGASGPLQVLVYGRLGPAQAGLGNTAVMLRSDEHIALTVTLQSDLAMQDGDLGDAASPADGSVNTGEPPDAAVLPPRVMFMTQATTGGNFAAVPQPTSGVAAIDALCDAAAKSVQHHPILNGRTFKTFVARPDLTGLAVALKIDTASIRPIVNVDGTGIGVERDLLGTSATFNGPRLDENGAKFDGTTSSQCAWTGFPQAGGTWTCLDWLSAESLQKGTTGQITTVDWRLAASNPCTDMCRLYCLEVP